MTFNDLPAVEAVLNGTSAILLMIGYLFIRRGWVKRHATMMIAAVVFSIGFLVCYLTYHAYHGTTRFPELGWIRTAYLLILLTHTLLAAIVPVLVIIVLYRAFRRQWHKHRRLARWTLPIWLYVSITGVVIYWMLYHLAPAMT